MAQAKAGKLPTHEPMQAKLRKGGDWPRSAARRNFGTIAHRHHCPPADPPDQPEMDIRSMAGLLACGSGRSLAFPALRPVANEASSPLTVAGAAPDWTGFPI